MHFIYKNKGMSTEIYLIDIKKVVDVINTAIVEIIIPKEFYYLLPDIKDR
jgi:hypothetical protein